MKMFSRVSQVSSPLDTGGRGEISGRRKSRRRRGKGWPLEKKERQKERIEKIERIQSLAEDQILAVYSENNNVRE